MLVYLPVLLTVLCGFVSLAVDLGRVQVAKTELRTAADAAAMSAMAGLATSVSQAQANAVSAAIGNTADGTPIVLDPLTDVEFGSWNSTKRLFTPVVGTARSSASAVRVTVRRTAANGNAVPLVFARVLGRGSCDVLAFAVSTSRPTGYGVIGLDYITMAGNATDSYWSTSGEFVENAGAIGSNGDITLSGSSAVHGDANPGINHTVYGQSRVSGGTASILTPFEFANGSSAGHDTINDNYNVPSGVISQGSFLPPANTDYTLPGGFYFFKDFYMSNNNTLTFTGAATIYCYGNFTLWGGANTSGKLPGNLNIVMVPNPYTGIAPGTLTIGSGTELYANIYAPQSPIVLSGNGDIYGSVLGKSVDMTGNSAIHYDLSLEGNNHGYRLVQ